MVAYAETLTEKERRRGRIYAYFACLFGCVSEVMIDSSAIIIIYFTMLKGGDMLTMLGTSFSGLMGTFLYIPGGIIVMHLGLKRTVRYACMLGCAGFLLMALAPLFGVWAKYAALAGCLIYSIQRSCYGATWYPLLDIFLRQEDRAKFFGMMRFFYTCFTGGLFFVIGLILQKNPPIIFIQLVIAVTGLLILGRNYCISRFPDNLRDAPEKPQVKKGLSIALHNGSLTAYSVYVGLLMLSYNSLLPMLYLYLKQYVQMNSGTVQILSSIGLVGSMTGYLCYSRVFNDTKLKYLELLVHVLCTVVALLLFLVDKSMPGFTFFAGAMVWCLTFAASIHLCNFSAELLTLARPGNKMMAMTFVQTYSNCGTAVSRVGVSLILGTAMLAPVWEFCGREVSRYQTLFLASFVMLLILFLLLPTLSSFVPPASMDNEESKK